MQNLIGKYFYTIASEIQIMIQYSHISLKLNDAVSGLFRLQASE